MEYRAETPSKLLVRIRVILVEMQRETLNAVFLERTDGTIAKMRAGRMSRVVIGDNICSLKFLSRTGRG
jgi:hypothetical protein